MILGIKLSGMFQQDRLEKLTFYSSIILRMLFYEKLELIIFGALKTNQ